MDQKSNKTRRYFHFFALLTILIAIAHIFGYRIFGSPKLVRNQPLNNPRKLSHITDDGKVILDNGNLYQIYGITMIQYNPLEQSRYFKNQALSEKSRKNEDYSFLEVEVEEPGKEVSKLWYKHRILYWCGNTLMPRFFPGRLKRFSKVDLAVDLVRHGCAIPDMRLFEQEPHYANELVDALSSIASELKPQQNEEHIRELGDFLFYKSNGHFKTGAWLLYCVGDSEFIYTLNDHIETQIEEGFIPGQGIDWASEIEELYSILVNVSPKMAKDLFNNVIKRYPANKPYIKVRMAVQLIGIKDKSAVDTLIREMYDETLEKSYRASILHELPRRFPALENNDYHKLTFTGQLDAFREWYEQNKSKWELANNRYNIRLAE